MKNQVQIFVALLLLGGNLSANTLNIPYTGGKQTGTFKIAGDGLPQGYADTAIIDGTLLLTNFTASRVHPIGCGGTVYEGLFIGSQNGTQGKLGNDDTVWVNALTFPGSLLPLDSISDSNDNLNKNFGNNPRGVKVDSVMLGGYCNSTGYNFIPGYNDVVYFEYNNGSGERYGKLMIYGVEYAPFYGFGISITSFDFAYTISNTTDLNSGPVGIYRFRQNARTSSFSNQLFDPIGRRFQRGSLSNQAFPSIPLLSPKP